jgi:hypothetical protein
MLIWLLSVAFANQCLVDYYNPPLEIFSQYQCLEEDARSPASIRKLKPEVSAKTIDGLNPKWTAQQRRVYRMLRAKSFNGADLNNDGTPDIQITKLQGGGQKITLSSGKDRKIAQISVFDSYGKLVSERIDTDMDGQVDQVYECKDQSCERQYNIVNGKPQRLVRTIASGPDEVIEMYEDKNGKLELIKRTTSPIALSEFSVGSNGATEGGLPGCGPECYDRSYNLLMTLLDDFEAAQKVNVRKPNLKKIGNFYESRVGVLIHEECFQQYGDDVEKWVTDATVEGLNCHITTEFEYDSKGNGRGQSYSRHIPQLVNLFSRDRDAPVTEGAVYYNKATGKVEIMENPCENHAQFGLNLGSKIHPDNCSFNGSFNLTQPKIICQVDKLELAVNESGSENAYANAAVRAYATNPNYLKPAFINWPQGKTEVVNHPIIGMVPRATKFSEAEFKSTYWHEIMHNCGNSHKDTGHPDYAYFCATACFGKAHSFSDILIEGAKRQCESAVISDNTHTSLETIKRVIGTH